MDVLDNPQFDGKGKPSRTLDEVLRDGYEFKFGEYLGRVFQLLKPTWGYLIGNTAMLVGILIVIELIVIFSAVGFLSNRTTDLITTDSDLSNVIAGILGVYALIILVVLAIVVPLRAGVQVFLHRGTKTGNYRFNDFFEAFRHKWAKLVAMVLFIGIISLIWIAVPYWYFVQDMINSFRDAGQGGYNPNPFAAFRYLGWMLLGYIPMLYFQVSYSLAIPLLLFQTNDVWKALEGSRKIVAHKGYYWFLFFGYYILMYILTLSGILACGIGLLLTMNAFALGIFAIYEGIFDPGAATRAPEVTV